jgi:uncharacterized membrane protein YdjX (TVP38/TMEM64 family)
MHTKLSAQQIIGLVIFIAVFVMAAYISQIFSAELTMFVETYGLLGQLIYFSIALLATVFAPLNMMFLVPVASTAFGPLVATLLSIAGWTTGSIIAFHIAKQYGRPLVARFVSLKKVDYLQDIVPEKNIFIWVVLMRMAVPADILSYVLGLFLHISYTRYSLATLIGVTPFAFIFAYASTLALPFMLTALALACLSTTLGIWWLHRQLRDKNEKRNIGT